MSNMFAFRTRNLFNSYMLRKFIQPIRLETNDTCFEFDTESISQYNLIVLITIQLFKHKEALVLIHDLWIHNHYQRIIKFANLPKEVCVKQRFVHCVHNGISNSRFCLFQICNWFACNAYTMESVQWHANFMENVSIVWRIGTKT